MLMVFSCPTVCVRECMVGKCVCGCARGGGACVCVAARTFINKQTTKLGKGVRANTNENKCGNERTVMYFWECRCA